MTPYISEEEALMLINDAALIVENEYMVMEADAMYVIRKIFGKQDTFSSDKTEEQDWL